MQNAFTFWGIYVGFAKKCFMVIYLCLKSASRIDATSLGLNNPQQCERPLWSPLVSLNPVILHLLLTLITEMSLASFFFFFLLKYILWQSLLTHQADCKNLVPYLPSVILVRNSL